jgi:hypothetical protein
MRVELPSASSTFRAYRRQTFLYKISEELPVSRNLTADSCPVPRRLLPAIGQLGILPLSQNH